MSNGIPSASTASAVFFKYAPAPPKSKHSNEVMNDFVFNEIDLGQAYYWTKEWQDGEKEADEDIKRGRMKRFKSAKDTIKYLRSKRK